MKKSLVTALLAAVLLLSLLSACAGDAKKERYINVYNWGQYISDGSDGFIDVNAEFTRRTGIKVNYSTYDTNEVMHTKLKNGGSSYDVVIPSDYMIARLIEEDMLLPLDFANIPNFARVDDEFKNMGYDPANAYSVPYTWGTVGIIYNTKYVTEKVDSWDLLWNEKYAGKILMFGNPRDAFGVAQLLLGINVNTTSEAELRRTADKLAEQKPLVQSYVMDESFTQMEREEAWIVPYYAGDFLTMQGENESLAFCFPKEGFNLFIDALCIPNTCQDKEAAEMYINFLCDPEISGKNMDFLGYSTPISDAKQYMSEDMAESEIAYPPAEVLERGVTFSHLPEDTIRYSNTLWSDIRGGDGVSWIVYVIIAAAVAALAVFFVVRKKKRDSY